MSDFENVEDAYYAIAQAAMAFPAGRAWQSISSKYGVLSTMVSASWSIHTDSSVDETGKAPPKELRNAAMDAALYLRDDLLKTTGQRIWGLTFTLHPDGKFNIEYDYNKPEGYEETDEAITGDEINASLGNLANKGPQ